MEEGFNNILNIRTCLKDKIEEIEKIKKIIRQNYIECVEKESQNYFGLDSVHFQNKLIELEFLNILNLHIFIDNRIYCDYYKLFCMMDDYLKNKLLKHQYTDVTELQKRNIYPVYKDLETTKKYNFDTINNIHADVIRVIQKVSEIHEVNKAKIESTQGNVNYSINLDNYIINQQYINKELLMTNELHSNYITGYHKFHDTILQNFLEKVEVFFEQINHRANDQSPLSDERKVIFCTDFDKSCETFFNSQNAQM